MKGESTDDLVRALRECGALKFGDFLLKSGRRSDFYLDVRVLSTTRHVALAARRLLAAAASLGPYDALAGPATGACPLLGACMVLADRPLRGGWVLGEDKGHGAGGRVQGSVRPGDRVVALEDVTTTGRSLIDAVLRLHDFGCVVVGATCVVDRGGEAGPLLAREGVPFAPVLTLADLGLENST